VQTYFSETYDQSSPEYVFTTTAQSAFLQLLTSLANIMTYPEHMMSTLDALIMSTKGIEDGSLFKRSMEGMQLDLLLKRIRLIIQGIVKSESPPEIKVKCVELLIRIGITAGNPEDLILAAQYQFEFKINISKHLGFLLNQSECFEEPKMSADDSANFSVSDSKRIQSKCNYEGENRQHTHDKMVCDGSNYFTYSDVRGLSRATRLPTREFKIAKNNT